MEQAAAQLTLEQQAVASHHAARIAADLYGGNAFFPCKAAVSEGLQTAVSLPQRPHYAICPLLFGDILLSITGQIAVSACLPCRAYQTP